MSAEEVRGACPYVGLDPFGAGDSDYFFGRKSDERIIIANLLSTPLTILYGGAGVGKTSVLMAGVIPQLRKDYPRTPVVLFREWRGADYAMRLSRACIDATWGLAVDQPRPASSLPLDEVLRACAEAAHGTVLVILDQFEDYLTEHPKDNRPDSFEAQLARAVNRAEVDCGVLISVREASLPRLDRFQERIPNLLGNRLQLRHLDSKAAQEAIREPLRVWNERHPAHPVQIETALVEEIVRQVRPRDMVLTAGSGQGDERAEDDDIETSLLQLVLTRLWKEDHTSGSLKADTFVALQGAREIVRAHLSEVMTLLDASRQAVCASFFDRLVTPSGGKVACSVRDFARWAEERAALVPELLDFLSQRRILKTVPEAPGVQDGMRYEILFDALAPAILDWRTRFVEDLRRERAVTQARELARKRARQRWTWLLSGMTIIAAFGWARAYLQGQTRAANQFAAEARLAVHYDPKLALERALQAVDKLSPFALTAPVEDALRVAVQAAAPSEWVQPLGGDVKSVAISADGKTVAVGVLDRRARAAVLSLHDSATGAKLSGSLSFPATGGDAGGVGWLQGDGLAAAFGTTMRLWANNDLSSKPRLFEHDGPINTAFAVSPDGQWIATGGGDKATKEVRIWRVSGASERPTRTIPVEKGWLFGLAFSPDGRAIAGASVDPLDEQGNHIAIWNTENGERILTLPMKVGSDSLVFTPDGRGLVCSGRDSRIYVWTLDSLHQGLLRPLMGPPAYVPRIPRILAGHLERVRQVAVSADGSRLASASTDGSVKIWDAVTGQNLMTLELGDSSAEAVAFSPDGAHVVAGGRSHKLHMWSIARHIGSVNAVTFGSAPGTMISAGGDRSLRLWDVSGGVPRQQRIMIDRVGGPAQEVSHQDAIYRVAMHPDGVTLASASFDRTVKLWNTRDGSVLRRLQGHTDQLRGVAFSADGQYLASAGADGRVLLHDLKAPERTPVEVSVRDEQQVYAVAMHPDASRRLWLSGARGAPELELWSIDGKKLGGVNLKSLPYAVAFMAQGTVVVALAGNTLVTLPLAALERSDDSGMRRRQIEDTRRCRALAYSHARDQLAIGCANSAIHLFDAKSLEHLKQLNVHDTEVLGLAFSADGNTLASASQDGDIVVSPLDLNRLEVQARQRWRALSSQP